MGMFTSRSVLAIEEMLICVLSLANTNTTPPPPPLAQHTNKHMIRRYSGTTLMWQSLATGSERARGREGEGSKHSPAYLLFPPSPKTT